MNAATLCQTLSDASAGLTSAGNPSSAKPLAPVVFAFWQPGFANYPAMDCYHLTADIPGHPRHSTLSRRTLEQQGYRIPIQEASKAFALRLAGEA